MTLFNTGSTLIGVAQHVRQGRVAGHPRDAAVAVLPLPDRARARRAPRSTATRWRRSCRSGCGGRRRTTTLLDSAAGTGKLDTADGAAALATTMLGETDGHDGHAPVPRRVAALRTASRISARSASPTYKAALNAEFAESSYLFFDKIFTQGLGRQGHLPVDHAASCGPRHGGALRRDGTGERQLRVEKDLGAKRVGYFSQLPFLTLHGHNAEPDSIQRGVTLNLDVLCATLGSARRRHPAASRRSSRADQPPAHRRADRRLRPELSQRHDQPARLRLRELRRHGPVARTPRTAA